jgi:hypothetical protein
VSRVRAGAARLRRALDAVAGAQLGEIIVELRAVERNEAGVLVYVDTGEPVGEVERGLFWHDDGSCTLVL